MDECESLDSEMTELQEFQSEASEAASQDDEDEVEELQNSLREVVQDQSVKPKLQCLMVDPAFSMVTVQSEDSGIVWETASSRCSTPWASETSSISDGCSMEGSGAAGKITIVFDEEKIVRRRTRSGGRSSRLGDRLSRPGSSRSASALGVERLEMLEVSLPNVKQEKPETEPDLEEIKNKDQQLFSLISEGYEILNIRVPSKLPTVDEEESTELQDNLSYLDQTPKIKSRNHHDLTQQQNHVLPTEGKIPEPSGEESSQADAELRHTQTEGTSDIDYFEKFTLVDVVAPSERAPEPQEEAVQPAAKPQVEDQKPAKETARDSPPASEDSFVFVTDVEIAGEHLDEVFYGGGAPADARQRGEDEETEDGARMRMRRESQRSGKENGSVLFGSEETILTPIYISSGPPKIIDPILLEEPTAMSFMYSDLYEDAVGERRKSDEEYSEAESVASEKFFRRRLSDSEEADGYLEKFILKDETPTVEVQPESARGKDRRDRRMMWSQSQFEMTGCLIRAAAEEDEAKTQTEEPKTQGGEQNLKLVEEKIETEQEEQTGREELIQELKQTEDHVKDQEVRHEVKKDQTEPPESSTDEGRGPKTPQVGGKDEKTEEEEHQREVPAEATTVIEAEQPCQTQGEAEKTAQEVVNAPEEKPVTAPVSTEVPHVITSEIKSEIPAETAERGSSEEAGTDTKTVAPDVKVKPEAIAEVQEPETEGQEILASTEIETLADASFCEHKEASEVVPEDVAPVEVITDCDAAVQAVVEVSEKAVNEKEIQTQVQIDLQEAAGVETKAAPEAEEAHEALTEESPAERSQTPETINKAALEPDVTAVISSEVTEPVMPEEISVDSEKKQHEILESKEHQQDESVTDSESGKTKPTSEATEEIGVQEMVKVGDEVILLVPKGRAVEMDIEISQWTEKTTSETVALSEPDSTHEHLIHPETSAICPETLQAPNDEATIEPRLEVKPEVALQEEAPPGNELDNSYPPPAPVEEANTEEQKVECDFEEDKEVFSPLRSFTPQEDLTGLHREEMQSGEAGVQQMSEIPNVEDAPETIIVKEEPSLEIDLHREDMQSVEADREQKSETHKVEEVLETTFVQEASGPELDLQREDIKPEAADVEQHSKMHKVEDAPQTSIVKEDSVQEIDQQSVEADTRYKSETNKTEDTLETTTVDQDSGPEIVLHREDMKSKAADVEEKAEMLKVENAPETRIDDAGAEIVLLREDILSKGADAEEKAEMQKVEDAPETAIVKEDSGLEVDVHVVDIQAAGVDQKTKIHKVDDAPEAFAVKSPAFDLLSEDVGKKMERQEAVTEAPEVIIEELEYEVISEHDAKEMPEPETPRDAEEPEPRPVQEKMEEEEKEKEEEVEEEKAFDLSPEEELFEADYDIIDAEEEKQARLAAELEGMDWFCHSCGCLLSEDDCVSGEHHDHELTTVDKAYEDIKEKLSDWISELQGRSENIEDLVAELELAYNSVEDHCVETEAAMQAQNEEMMALVMEQYNSMSVSMEEEKKAKLEQLYDQIVSFQESIDSTKATLETSTREAETEARSTEDIEARLKEALDSAMSLELGPKGLLVFEDYAKGNTSSSHLAQRKGIPVPQRPTLQPQEPGSASCTSVTVYWKVNPGDIIDCFQVYCMEDPHGAVSEEYRVTVKESYCVLEELEPDKTYKVWVMAVNYTGCSLPSERLTFRTAPSVPVIDTERCTVMWDSATLRWSSNKQTPEHSYTLEYCRQYELEGEGLRSVSGIKSCEQKVLLQPSENYLFYIKAVNEAGASEQSEAALISTKGTRFHLLKDSAHPALDLSVDQTTLHYSQDAHENTPPTEQRCPSILGELLLAQGHHYWETIVSGSTAYRLGVAYSTANRNSPLGENNLSWCLQCIPTPSGCRFQLLHNDVQSSVFVIEMPERVGTLLDYQLGRLSFYNAQSGQLIGTFSQRFTQPCHPALGLEMPGSLEVCMVPEVPEFTKDS